MKSKMMSIVTATMLAAALAGCTSYPFIDESIAQLDASPVSVATRFNLPDDPPLTITPQSTDLLVGDWLTGYQNLACREVGQDGLIHNLPDDHKNAAEVYGFYADGSYGHNYIYQLGALLLQLKAFGKWSYDSGILTLKREKMEMKVQNFLAKQQGYANWDQEFPLDMKEPAVTTYRVDWFAHNEIAIILNDETPPPSSGSREVVHVDAHGVRTKREIKVMGTREGRETGTIEETIYPPMHFKKKEKSN